MKTFIMIFLNSLLLNSQALASDVITIDDIDLKQYTGLWHQVAVIPNSFQKQCVSDTTAEYRLIPNNKNNDGVLEVINDCTNKEGQREPTLGCARVNPKANSTGKLEVTFLRFSKWWQWFAAGDYWIMELPSDYSYVVVGHPKRKFGWILSRTRTLNKETLQNIRKTFEQQGYDPCRLKMSPNSETKFERTPSLCQYLDN